MIIAVGYKENNVVLEDNSGQAIKLSNKLSEKDFTAKLDKLDFAYGLRKHAIKYYRVGK